MSALQELFIIATIVLLYGYVSKLLERFNISGPMVFTLFGFLLSPLGIGHISLDLNAESVKIVAELALIVVLFSDSSTLNVRHFKEGYKIPTRLLFIGLPLTILFTTYAGTLFFSTTPLLYIIVMALILAPTDAALGKAVVIDKSVPKKIRSGINIESGLNDGIVFPLLIAVLLLISLHKELGSDNSWIIYLLKQISFGLVIGALSGFLGAKGLNFAQKKEWIESSYKNLIPLSLAILTYFIAEHLGGNGFIAVFISGLFFGSFTELLKEEQSNFLVSEGEVLILISFLIFGLTFIPLTVEQWSPKVFVFAFLSLTLFRILPVFVSLIGLGLSNTSKLFIGWFGPRGIASILYVMTVAHSVESNMIDKKLFAVISVTILLSIILHGLSATPLVKRYGSKLD